MYNKMRAYNEAYLYQSLTLCTEICLELAN